MREPSWCLRNAMICIHVASLGLCGSTSARVFHRWLGALSSACHCRDTVVPPACSTNT